jgi:hypothetical protein
MQKTCNTGAETFGAEGKQQLTSSFVGVIPEQSSCNTSPGSFRPLRPGLALRQSRTRETWTGSLKYP